MEFICWCNENNGFLTAVLSIIGLLLSMIAIVVSVSTARMPYKKRLLLGSSILISASLIPGISTTTQTAGLSVSATNVGNRTITITYLGIAIKKEGRLYKLNPINRDFRSSAKLSPSEMHEVQFYKEELIDALKRENKATKLYIFANDTEGAVYKRKAGTIGRLMDNLGQ